MQWVYRRNLPILFCFLFRSDFFVGGAVCLVFTFVHPAPFSSLVVKKSILYFFSLCLCVFRTDEQQMNFELWMCPQICPESRRLRLRHGALGHHDLLTAAEQEKASHSAPNSDPWPLKVSICVW